MSNYSFYVGPSSSYSTFYSLPYLHFNLSSTLSFNSNDPNCVGWVNFQRWLHFIHQEVIFISEITLGLVTFSFTFWREQTERGGVVMFTGNQHRVSINSLLCCEPCLTTWTSLATLSRWFQRMLAWVLAGARDAFAVLEAIGTSAQDAFQDLPQNWVPHVSMRVRLAIV